MQTLLEKLMDQKIIDVKQEMNDFVQDSIQSLISQYQNNQNQIFVKQEQANGFQEDMVQVYISQLSNLQSQFDEFKTFHAQIETNIKSIDLKEFNENFQTVSQRINKLEIEYMQLNNQIKLEIEDKLNMSFNHTNLTIKEQLNDRKLSIDTEIAVSQPFVAIQKYNTNDFKSIDEQQELTYGQKTNVPKVNVNSYNLGGDKNRQDQEMNSQRVAHNKSIEIHHNYQKSIQSNKYNPGLRFFSNSIHKNPVGGAMDKLHDEILIGKGFDTLSLESVKANQFQLQHRKSLKNKTRNFSGVGIKNDTHTLQSDLNKTQMQIGFQLPQIQDQLSSQSFVTAKDLISPSANLQQQQSYIRSHKFADILRSQQSAKHQLLSQKNQTESLRLMRKFSNKRKYQSPYSKQSNIIYVNTKNDRNDESIGSQNQQMQNNQQKLVIESNHHTNNSMSITSNKVVSGSTNLRLKQQQIIRKSSKEQHSISNFVPNKYNQ
ncbi:UNKNOWN [Stylonychia lemnae]|uniref:Uncharacterized protein n=1 Tax=Stylonychia lemnae TaxID=5949 RepID=A0A077ZWB2_STYLE|nr:UNKNOWN [Stylonychia lemnae]|eukprot:CDW74230.1 UNKNOWN [Stylonychia lemnae]